LTAGYLALSADTEQGREADEWCEGLIGDTRADPAPMNRIAIVGCSGGGKSTLARALAARLGPPVIHLDVIYWKPGWTPGDREATRAEVEAAVSAERWICEGNFIEASALRFARADTIVWVDLPRLACLRRAVWRAITGFGRDRSDLAPGCPEKIDFAFYRYIWTWDRRTRPRMDAAIAAHGAHARLVRLRSDREAAAFLASVTPAPAGLSEAGDRARS
jgi:adenylate kinase family enzyme